MVVSSIGNLRTIIEQAKWPLIHVPATVPLVPKLPTASTDVRANAAELTRPRQRMLDALASFEALGVMELRRGNLAVFSGQSPKSSGYKANLSAIHAMRLIAYLNGDCVSLTSAGRELSAPSNTPTTLEELHRAWLTKLPAPRGCIVQALIAAYPGTLQRESLAHASVQSPTSSGYKANLSAVHALGLASYPVKDEVVATELLFPTGLS